MSDTFEYDRETARLEADNYPTPAITERRRLIKEKLNLQPNETVLSIGCGPGFEPAELADDVSEEGFVVGIDRNKAMLALAQRRCAELSQVTLGQADAVALPVGNQMVNAALSVQVYEYVDNVESAIHELSRVLRPGGRAVVYATDWDSVVWRSSDRERMERVLEAWKGHCSRPQLGSHLAPFLRDAGFSIDHVEPYSILNTQLTEGSFVYYLLQFITDYTANHNAIGPSEAEEWAEDLYTLDKADQTFFNFTQYLYHVCKPE